MKIWSSCPHCGLRNETDIIGDIWTGSAVARCDRTTEGCDKRYVIDWIVRFDVRAIKIED